MYAFRFTTTDRPRRTRTRLSLPVALALLALASCGDGPTGPADPDPTTPPPGDTAIALPATEVTRGDLSPEGTVVETGDGYTVDGALSLRTSDTTSVTFLNADLRVRFDDQDRVTSISGTTQIPSPHPRIRFHDPVQATVGFFRGSFLNQNRDLGIRLLDEEDYFVFDVAVSVGMDIATGETGEEATQPITVKVPVGGRILEVIDYDDPMYFIYGEQDLIGAAGMGWSLNGRIPFEPARSVAELGAFQGKTIRTGTFPIFKVFSITGETVDNNYTELHLAEEDPWAGELRQGYQQGWNGSFELDLSIKDVVGIVIPVADGSGGIFAEASTADGLKGHAYGVGATTRDFSWYPEFIPMKPASALDVDAFVTDEGRFEVGLAGQYGWEFPGGDEVMTGAVELSDQAFALSGSLVNGPHTFGMTGRVTDDTTIVALDYPAALTDAVAGHINDEVLPRIDSAQAAWNDLEDATADYEFELSLRGVRTQLPGIADGARSELDAAVAAELSPHRGKIYYDALRAEVNRKTAPYYAALARLEAEARRTTDNAATRNAIDSALRDVAARKIFQATITIKDPVFGTTLYSKTIRRRILSDANAEKLLDAASHVPMITETSDRKIRMQQIYDEAPDQELFEQIRDDMRDELVIVEDLGTIGFVHPHEEGQRAFNVFVVIDGRVRRPGTVSDMAVATWAGVLWESVLDALKVN
jgi:hypothetical protein